MEDISIEPRLRHNERSRRDEYGPVYADERQAGPYSGAPQPARPARAAGPPAAAAADPEPEEQPGFFQRNKVAIIVAVIVLAVFLLVVYLYVTRKNGSGRKRRELEEGDPEIQEVNMEEVKRLRALRRQRQNRQAADRPADGTAEATQPPAAGAPSPRRPQPPTYHPPHAAVEQPPTSMPGRDPHDANDHVPAQQTLTQPHPQPPASHPQPPASRPQPPASHPPSEETAAQPAQVSSASGPAATMPAAVEDTCADVYVEEAAAEQPSAAPPAAAADDLDSLLASLDV